jgi:hypothetical protein
MSNSEAHLDSVALKQLTWKPSTIRDVAVGVVEKIILPPFKLWPDQVSLAAVLQGDRQVVGTAWRLLSKAEVIQQTGNYRRSTAAGRHGGSVFEYQLRSMNRAKTFLCRNGVVPKVAEVQSELFAMPTRFPNN